MGRRLLWGIAGLLSYVGAAILLAMAVAPLFAGGAASDFTADPMSVGLLVASTLLFGLGGWSLRRAAADERPAVESDGDGEHASREGKVQCEECGTSNEPFYTYCEDCAHKL